MSGRNISPKKAVTGELPWSAVEFRAVKDFEFATFLEVQRKTHEPSREAAIGRIKSRVAQFIEERYRRQGVDPITRISHVMRYFAMCQFMTTHADRLFDEGLLKMGCDDGAPSIFCGPLLCVLARARYSSASAGTPTEGAFMVLEPEFDVEKVILDAKRLQATMEN